jgi:hypothetical protein
MSAGTEIACHISGSTTFLPFRAFLHLPQGTVDFKQRLGLLRSFKQLKQRKSSVALDIVHEPDESTNYDSEMRMDQTV